MVAHNPTLWIDIQYHNNISFYHGYRISIYSHIKYIIYGVFRQFMLRAFLGVFSAGRFWAFYAEGVFGRFYALGVSGRFYTETPSKKAFSGVSPLPMIVY